MGEITVADVMTAPVLTLAAETPIDEAARAMREAGIKSLVVIDSECSPGGIFTSTDAVQVAADDRSASEVTVGEYMTTGVRTIDPGTSPRAVAGEMIEQEINHLPVVDEERKAIGILTTTDLVDHLSTESNEQATRM
jgi:signal-transduction protein with cAMP-binding, CBS, and nucleotidyltransferase domain